MIEIERILLPCDFSEHAATALASAVPLARWYGAEITALHVLPRMLVPVGPGVSDAFEYGRPAPTPERDARAKLQAFCGADAGVPVRAMVQEGDAAEDILALAERLRADLIVMGSRGRGAYTPWVLGSVAEKVLRRAPVAVLTTPAAPPRGRRETGGRYAWILCGIDFSRTGQRALDYALSIAQRAGARLTILHVIESMAHHRDSDFPLASDAYWRYLAERDEELIDHAIPDEARTMCELEEKVLVGKPYREILQLAQSGEADLIVLGAHGRSATDRSFFGSTADHVVRAAECPVLTVR